MNSEFHIPIPLKTAKNQSGSMGWQTAAKTAADFSACHGCFAVQSVCMETKWAADNLQTIRTLMERSALYRRALAPIMILAGTIGIAAGLAGWLCRIENTREFVCLWGGAAIVSLVGALLLIRRQALKDSEPFWSPPTRRVSQALLPAFFVGLVMACLILVFGPSSRGDEVQLFLVTLWVLFYGCAVHAAGFFMPRGIRWLGWIFIIVGSVLLSFLNMRGHRVDYLQPHLVMGVIFGGLHIVYGIYLYFTEQKAPTT